MIKTLIPVFLQRTELNRKFVSFKNAMFIHDFGLKNSFDNKTKNFTECISIYLSYVAVI